MFLHILSKQSFDFNDENNCEGVEILEKEMKLVANEMKQKGIMKNKIQFLSKVLKMQKVLREENENVLRIKEINNNKLPHGILLDGKEAMEVFMSFKKIDSKNESRPY